MTSPTLSLELSVGLFYGAFLGEVTYARGVPRSSNHRGL